MGVYRIHSGGVYRSKSELLQRGYSLLFYYSLPSLLGKDLTDTIRVAVDERTRRAEHGLAYAIGHCSDLRDVLRLLRIMQTNALVPKGRVPAILSRVPFVTAHRLSSYLKAFTGQTLRGRTQQGD